MPKSKTVQMKRVVSSNLHSVGYDQGSRLLYVNFKDGGKYMYHNVPVKTYNMLTTAVSAGTYFNEHVKYSFKYEKLE